jgi:hypothetical protein
MAEAIYFIRIVMARTLPTEVSFMLHAIAITLTVSLTADYFSTTPTLTQSFLRSAPTLLSVSNAAPHP